MGYWWPAKVNCDDGGGDDDDDDAVDEDNDNDDGYDDDNNCDVDNDYTGSGQCGNVTAAV